MCPARGECKAEDEIAPQQADADYKPEPIFHQLSFRLHPWFETLEDVYRLSQKKINEEQQLALPPNFFFLTSWMSESSYLRQFKAQCKMVFFSENTKTLTRNEGFWQNFKNCLVLWNHQMLMCDGFSSC